MSTAGLITELLFRAAGLVPTMRPTTVAPANFSWNYTTYLNLVVLALFGVLYWLYRNRARLGAGERYARDPVCGMQVEKRRRRQRSPTPGNGTTSARIAVRSGSRAVGMGRSTRHCKAGSAMQPERIIEQLEKMTASGRITPVDAARLRAAAGTAETSTTRVMEGPSA